MMMVIEISSPLGKLRLGWGWGHPSPSQAGSAAWESKGSLVRGKPTPTPWF